MPTVRILSTLAVIAATFAWGDAAHAQVQRSWVAGLGSDTNPCSRTAPCKTFSMAYSVTQASGEIDCVDAGAYGSLTITKSITIDCEDVSNGGIVVAGTTAITIGAAGIVVNLRGLNIDGLAAGGTGINIVSAATVTLKNVKIYGFSTGISFAPTSAGGSLIVGQSVISNNATGVSQNGTSGSVNMLVSDSVITNNSTYGIIVQTSSAHSGATIDRTTLGFNNGYGLLVFGAAATAIIGGSTVVNNGTGVSAQNGGVLQSFKDNRIGGNVSDGTPINAYPGGPLN